MNEADGGRIPRRKLDMWCAFALWSEHEGQGARGGWAMVVAAGGLSQGPATRARLYLDHVRSPVVARVTNSGPTGITVEQALPFLRLRSGLRVEDGRRAHIRSVGLAVDGDTPSLVLDLVYEEAGSSSGAAELDDQHAVRAVVMPTVTAKRPRRDHTIPLGLVGAQLGTSTRRPRRDPTIPFGMLPWRGTTAEPCRVERDRRRREDEAVVFRTPAVPEEGGPRAPARHSDVGRALAPVAAGSAQHAPIARLGRRVATRVWRWAREPLQRAGCWIIGVAMRLARPLERLAERRLV